MYMQVKIFILKFKVFGKIKFFIEKINFNHVLF